MISNQAFFNKVKKHLLTQMRKCRDKNSNCVYLKENGDRCAIGGVLPKKILAKIIAADMNTHAIIDILKIPGVRDHLPVDLDIVDTLQAIHDNYPSSEWRDKLTKMAKTHGLKA